MPLQQFIITVLSDEMMSVFEHGTEMVLRYEDIHKCIHICV